eukprot:CAMPEP_0202906700 /NCGR_PEP_ID=MMETSP1392-20130828/40046_1 /ASSEMBLY_ACC=CAM_ASM_000868 /TAXON_ID=225041 /ORGANISM="Chlamydomonas chlamydogama, Strain SAG 11-48b" /LENGTH=43 /DNA_ID= /DNA_START= /DNA_END= /DNA_ORIENTATION=
MYTPTTTRAAQSPACSVSMLMFTSPVITLATRKTGSMQAFAAT